MPAAWSRTAEGGEYFDVDDRFGRVELRVPAGLRPTDDYSASLVFDLVPEVSRSTPPPVSREQVLARLVGRHYCVEVPTGAWEERSIRHPCDAAQVAGTPERRATPACEEKVRVPATRREVRVVRAGTSDARASLQLLRSQNEGPSAMRLVWAVWVGGEPVSPFSRRLVDAYTGVPLTSYQFAGAARWAGFDGDAR